MPKRILHVVSNASHHANSAPPTRLWLSELTHAYDLFAAKGYAQRIVSPKGGVSPLEPRALKWPFLDASTKAWRAGRGAPLSATARAAEMDLAEVDAIYFTGGHAVCGIFPMMPACRASRALFGNGAASSPPPATAIAAGFSWTEEVLAGVANKMPTTPRQR